ncbi:LysR family transcriptional regulator [Martelella mediterranea]|uniref:LysR family transcriptional regulator n=1 Tax=Martelella mediterranea TaxID=293089 RepID=UPI00104D7071
MWAKSVTTTRAVRSAPKRAVNGGAEKGISQPALTKSLQLLEDELDAELFERTQKGLLACISK